MYVSHPQWVVAVDPYVLLLSCMALFACDALARRLQVSRQRRAVITVLVAVLLWSVTVVYGHPEDAIAIALAVYALISAMDGRFTKAGWIFGAAVAFQPLVLLMVPVLIAMAGLRKGIALGIRSVLPSAVLLSVPLIANFSATFRELVDQPSFPNVNHATPWTALATRLGGHGSSLTVAAGPVRRVGYSCCHWDRHLGGPATMARAPGAFGLRMCCGVGAEDLHGVGSGRVLSRGSGSNRRGGCRRVAAVGALESPFVSRLP